MHLQLQLKDRPSEKVWEYTRKKLSKVKLQGKTCVCSEQHRKIAASKGRKNIHKKDLTGMKTTPPPSP